MSPSFFIFAFAESKNMLQKISFIHIVLLCLAVNLLVMNHSVTYWDEDEAAYAGFATNMLQSGDWVNPTFEHATIHRKTPLHFWTIAISYSIFGQNEFATRLPSVLAIFFTCLLVLRFGRTVVGEEVSKWATVILASSVMLPLMGKIAFTDATLLFFSTLSVLSLWNYLNTPNWRWNVGLWMGIVGGVLTKGPPIILLMGGIWVLTAFFHPKRRNLIGTHPWFYGLIALLPFVGWCYASYLQDLSLWKSSGASVSFDVWWQDEFEGRKIFLLPFLWDWYVVRRVGGNVLGQSGFPGYHFIVLTVAFLTWLPFWLPSIRRIFSSLRKPDEVYRFLLIWLAIGWVFWEFMSSKLPSYSFAAQPAIAILMAQIICQKEAPGKEYKLGKGLYFFIFTLFICALPVAGVLLFDYNSLFYLLPVSLLLLPFLYKAWKKRKDLEQFAIGLTYFGLAFMFAIWLFVAPLIENSSIKPFDDLVTLAASKLESPEKDGALVYCGLNNKQLKISPFVYARQTFNQLIEVDATRVISVLKENEKAVLVLGSEYPVGLIEKLENMGFLKEDLMYRSTDDALKRHDFMVFYRINR